MKWTSPASTASFILSPPLRSLRDRDALCEALKDGSIDAVCSDHAPLDDDAKQLPFGEASPGASGVELLLPLTLKWAAEHRVPLLDAIDRITWKPAQILGISAGHFSPARARMCAYSIRKRAGRSARAASSARDTTPRFWATRWQEKCVTP